MDRGFAGEAGSSSRTFLDDLRATFKTLKRTPGLVVLTVGLHLVWAGYVVASELQRRSIDTCLNHHLSSRCTAHPWLGLLGFADFLVSLFLIGFYGTQRVWFMRSHWDQQTEGSFVWRGSWAFVGRFLTLTLLAVPFVLPLFIIAARDFAAGRTLHPSILLRVALYGAWIIIDVFATFIAPALAFSTRRVRVAIPSGIKMLIHSWPQSAWYALAPPIAITLIGFDSIRDRYGLVIAVVVGGLIGPLIGLWARCATSLFYLRRVQAVTPFGAAFLSLLTCPQGHEVSKGALFCSVCGTDLREPMFR